MAKNYEAEYGKCVTLMVETYRGLGRIVGLLACAPGGSTPMSDELRLEIAKARLLSGDSEVKAMAYPKKVRDDIWEKYSTNLKREKSLAKARAVKEFGSQPKAESKTATSDDKFAHLWS